MRYNIIFYFSYILMVFKNVKSLSEYTIEGKNGGCKGC